MDLIDGLRTFVATAQAGSFTEAANRLGISNRLTSKYLAELETRIGARLLQRTTRKVGLTPAGRDLLDRAPALLDELEDMLGKVSQDSKGLSGLLRISAPVTFGEMYIKDLLSRYMAKHPEIDIDLKLDDAYADLASAGFDLAFRIGNPQNLSLKARKLGKITSQVVASPEYLAKSGLPETPQELVDHVCIMDTNRRDSRWIFGKEGEEIIVNPGRRYMVNSARVTRDWAISGCGIAMCPDFVLAQDILAGRLVVLLKDFTTQTHSFNIVYLEGKILPRKVRALIDFAVEDARASNMF